MLNACKQNRLGRKKLMVILDHKIIGKFIDGNDEIIALILELHLVEFSKLCVVLF